MLFLLSSCATHRRIELIDTSRSVSAPTAIELHEELSAATLHFPRGRYILCGEDKTGYFYRVPGKITQHTFGGQAQRDGGLYVRKSNLRKLRGFVMTAGVPIKVGNFSSAKHTWQR